MQLVRVSVSEIGTFAFCFKHVTFLNGDINECEARHGICQRNYRCINTNGKTYF